MMNTHNDTNDTFTPFHPLLSRAAYATQLVGPRRRNQAATLFEQARDLASHFRQHPETPGRVECLCRKIEALAARSEFPDEL